MNWQKNKISELESRSFENTQFDEHNAMKIKKNEQNLRSFIMSTNTYIMEVQMETGKRKGKKEYLKKQWL